MEENKQQIHDIKISNKVDPECLIFA